MTRPSPGVAGVSAIAGGIVWAVGAAGWLLTHGSQPDVNTAAILGLTGTQFTQLLILAALLWAVALAGSLPDRRAARVAWVVSLAGIVMIGLGALFETTIVDPVANFTHPIVQSGWLLFIGGLFPVLFAGMLSLAATSQAWAAERWTYAAIGATAPLPVVAFFIGGIAHEGAGGQAITALLHAAPGLAFVAFGLARRGARVAEAPAPAEDLARA